MMFLLNFFLYNLCKYFLMIYSDEEQDNDDFEKFIALNK